MLGHPDTERIGVSVLEAGLVLHPDKIKGLLLNHFLFHFFHIIIDRDLKGRVIDGEEVIDLDVILHDLYLVRKDRDRDSGRRRWRLHRHRDLLDDVLHGHVLHQGSDRPLPGRIRKGGPDGQQGGDHADFGEENPLVLQRRFRRFLGFHNKRFLVQDKGTPRSRRKPNFQAPESSRDPIAKH